MVKNNILDKSCYGAFDIQSGNQKKIPASMFVYYEQHADQQTA